MRTIGTIKSFLTGSLAILFLCLHSCKKEEKDSIAIETGTVTDIENNIYRTVKIGNQWWMAENLKVKTFSNGLPIAMNQTLESWIDTMPSYCIFDNKAEAPGLLYNWYAVGSVNNIAPTGWHVPSDKEWQDMDKYLGMSEGDVVKKGWRGNVEGDKLKKEGTSGWTIFSGVWSTNESGFNALAGGCRLFNGKWGEPGLFATGFWWTKSEISDTSQALYRYLDYKNSNIYRSNCDKNYGFSIRCVKD